MTHTHSGTREVAVRCIQMMADGDRTEFDALVHPDAVNHEGKAEPAAARTRGPAAYWASALWLRSAFTELSWEIHEIVATGDLVVLHTTMSGRQTGPFIVYGDDARPAQAFSPTGRTFAVTQTHWCRVIDGLIIEHWANRDDLGQATQLGWVPPTPAFLVRSQLALRRARRATASS